MPNPRENETKDEFMKRCMEVVYDEWTNDPDKTWDEERAYAYCNNVWEEEANSSKLYSSILAEYLSRSES